MNRRSLLKWLALPAVVAISPLTKVPLKASGALTGDPGDSILSESATKDPHDLIPAQLARNAEKTEKAIRKMECALKDSWGQE